MAGHFCVFKHNPTAVSYTHLATTALGTIHPLGREKGIQSGANVVMPNLSPVKDVYKRQVFRLNESYYKK